MVTTNYQVGSLDFAPYSNSTFLDDFYTDDVYSFSVGQPTYVELDLYNITFGDDADLYLYQDDGDFLFESNQDFFIESSRLAGNANDSISEFLGSGNYFAQVERYAPGSSGSLDYTID
ncbi:hypothetical protein Xen7305DRAFT_00022010, partial [Xenococcus sp. PCC 7305]|uniref:hypothetical protein n=1 Tax=Xenococcus sp. PCC 7305 TaxID=102125 RepID=UPI0002AD0611